MPIFLDRIDSFSPALVSDFPFEFKSWIAVLIDTLNASLETIQNNFNLLNASTYTAAEIADLFANGNLTDGIVLYDSTNNLYVGMESGALVKFTTTSYP
jgi:hypothetical protein